MHMEGLFLCGDTYLSGVCAGYGTCVGEHACCGEKRELPGGINCRGCFVWCYVRKVSGVCGGHGMYVGEHTICGERERERERN